MSAPNPEVNGDLSVGTGSHPACVNLCRASLWGPKQPSATHPTSLTWGIETKLNFHFKRKPLNVQPFSFTDSLEKSKLSARLESYSLILSNVVGNSLSPLKLPSRFLRSMKPTATSPSLSWELIYQFVAWGGGGMEKRPLKLLLIALSHHNTLTDHSWVGFSAELPFWLQWVGCVGISSIAWGSLD